MVRPTPRPRRGWRRDVRAHAMRRGARAGGVTGAGCVWGLARLTEIVAIKEASGSLGQMAEIIRLAGDKITLLSGDDNVTLPVLSIGGKGVISVIANLVPKDSSDLIEAWENGDVKTAQKIYYRLFPLCQAMFYETNPVPVKTSLALMGKITDELRLPLAPLSEGNLEKLKRVLKDFALI